MLPRQRLERDVIIRNFHAVSVDEGSRPFDDGRRCGIEEANQFRRRGVFERVKRRFDWGPRLIDNGEGIPRLRVIGSLLVRQ